MANTGGDTRPTLVLGELVFVGGVQGSVFPCLDVVVSNPYPNPDEDEG
jgi:hypothetical protein